MSDRENKLYLEDIYMSINKIEKYTKNLSFLKFQKDDKTVDAVIRNLEILGEAARNVTREFKSKNTQIPWREMVGLRNKVVHEYFGVDLEILWITVKDDLPVLKKEIKNIL